MALASLARALHALAVRLDPGVSSANAGPTQPTRPQLGAHHATRLGANPVRFCKKLFRRLLIWFVSLAVAFYVPVFSCGVPFPLHRWEEAVDKSGKQSDVFLAIVAMVVLSASDLIDNIIMHPNERADAITIGCAWIFMVIYFLFLFYGMASFGAGGNNAVIPSWDNLIRLLVIGLVGELIIATVVD